MRSLLSSRRRQRGQSMILFCAFLLVLTQMVTLLIFSLGQIVWVESRLNSADQLGAEAGATQWDERSLLVQGSQRLIPADANTYARTYLAWNLDPVISHLKSQSPGLTPYPKSPIPAGAPTPSRTAQYYALSQTRLWVDNLDGTNGVCLGTSYFPKDCQDNSCAQTSTSCTPSSFPASWNFPLSLGAGAPPSATVYVATDAQLEYFSGLLNALGTAAATGRLF